MAVVPPSSPTASARKSSPTARAGCWISSTSPPIPKPTTERWAGTRSGNSRRSGASTGRVRARTGRCPSRDSTAQFPSRTFTQCAVSSNEQRRLRQRTRDSKWRSAGSRALALAARWSTWPPRCRPRAGWPVAARAPNSKPTMRLVECRAEAAPVARKGVRPSPSCNFNLPCGRRRRDRTRVRGARSPPWPSSISKSASGEARPRWAASAPEAAEATALEGGDLAWGVPRQGAAVPEEVRAGAEQA